VNIRKLQELTDRLNYSDRWKKYLKKKQIYITTIYVATLNADISYTKTQSQHKQSAKQKD